MIRRARVALNFMYIQLSFQSFSKVKLFFFFFLFVLWNFYRVIIDVWRGERERGITGRVWPKARHRGKVNSTERPKNMSPAARCSTRVPLLLLLKSYFVVLNGLKKSLVRQQTFKNNNNNNGDDDAADENKINKSKRRPVAKVL